MINYKKINRLNDKIKLKKERLRLEKDVKIREKLKLKITIDELNIRIERLN